MSDISYIDEDPTKTPSPMGSESQKAGGGGGGNQVPRHGTMGREDHRNVRWTNSEIRPSTQSSLSPHRHISRTLIQELPKLVHETSI